MYKKKLDKLALEHTKAIKYYEIYKADCDMCWKTIEQVNDGLVALTFDRQKFLALQDNIRIQVLGFGRKRYHIQWSRNGKNTPNLERINHLKKNIIDKENPNNILNKAPINMPQRPRLLIL